MRIGIKLEPGFTTARKYRKLYGRSNIPAYLAEQGVRAAEFPVGPETITDILKDYTGICIAAGLTVSLHPYSERTVYNPSFFLPEEGNPCRDLHTGFFSFARDLAGEQNAEVIVNIHPAAGQDYIPRNHMLSQSIAFFSWAKAWCAEHAPGVRPVAELQISPNREERLYRVGDRFEELQEICEKSGVEACWDFGHSVMNASRFGFSESPSPDLQRHVVHAHCHDVEGHDHRPLIFGNVPWKRFLGMLKTTGFDGTVILEVTPEGFLENGGLESLAHSLKELRSYPETAS